MAPTGQVGRKHTSSFLRLVEFPQLRNSVTRTPILLTHFLWGTPAKLPVVGQLKEIIDGGPSLLDVEVLPLRRHRLLHSTTRLLYSTTRGHGSSTRSNLVRRHGQEMTWRSRQQSAHLSQPLLLHGRAAMAPKIRLCLPTKHAKNNGSGRFSETPREPRKKPFKKPLKKKWWEGGQPEKVRSSRPYPLFTAGVGGLVVRAHKKPRFRAQL